jgi:uncharacterized protein YegL
MEEMKKFKTELVFILDKSGSMCGLESYTVGGFNANLDKHRGENALVTTALFSNEMKVIHDRLDIVSVPHMSLAEFSVGGSTALYDAVGTLIDHVGNVHRYIRSEDVPDNTVFIIMTDGYENASCKFSHEMIRKMIIEKRELGWEFIFLGANIDTESVAHDMGIDDGLAMSFAATSKGVVKCCSDMWDIVDKAKKNKKKVRSVK